MFLTFYVDFNALVKLPTTVKLPHTKCLRISSYLGKLLHKEWRIQLKENSLGFIFMYCPILFVYLFVNYHRGKYNINRNSKN